MARVMDDRGLSPVAGAVMLILIAIVLAGAVGVMAVGMSEGMFDRFDEVRVSVDGECAGFDVVSVDASDYHGLHETLQENHCALWLPIENVEHDDGVVTGWIDEGPRGLDATQTDPDRRPQFVDEDTGIPTAAVRFDGENLVTPGTVETDGAYLSLERDVDSLDLDEESGLVVFAVVRAEEFNRGGAWTIGEGGEDGREFSLRTCSVFGLDGCQPGDPAGHWRAQHWGVADLDFESPATADQWAVMTHRYDGETVEVRVNGEVVDAAPADLDLGTNRDIQLGRWVRVDDEPAWYFTGMMAEVIVFDDALTEEELASVEAYLASKFDL